MPIRSRILHALPAGVVALAAAPPTQAAPSPPGALIASYSVGNANQTPTGNLIAGLVEEYAYSADIAPLTLDAGAAVPAPEPESLTQLAAGMVLLQLKRSGAI